MTATDRDGLQIRRAQPGEREALRELTMGAYIQYADVLRPEYWRSYEEHITATLDDIGAGEQWVAERDGIVLGTVLFYPPGKSFGDDVDAIMSADCPEVRLLAVSPESRGSGAGRALMQFSVERARDTGAPGLVLHTMSMMGAARALYESMGFVRAPELDFRPAKEWFVEGFRLPLSEATE
jgi:GNAT superfamily N-acetyltransferase